MVVGLKVDFLWYPIGEADLLHSFFSTICINLEGGQWGTKFPTLMNEFYKGNLDFSKVELAIDELHKIKEKFRNLSLDKIVWDANDLSKVPPWGDNISSDINDLSEYFWTNHGENLFITLEKAFNESRIEQTDTQIVNL